MVNVKNISFSYNRGAGKVLDDISFSIEDSQCIAVLGNNGVGKSTLLKCLDRIIPSQGGSVEVDGDDVFRLNGNELAKHIAYVPQSAELSDMTVFDAVLLGRKPYIKWDAGEDDRRIVEEVLKKLSLEKFSMRRMYELSGGELQKVCIARALAQEPKLLLLDEPTSNLDMRNQHEVLQTVRELAKTEHISVAIIIHDLNLALRYCDRFLFLKNSKIYSYGGLETVTSAAISDVYDIHVHIIEHMGATVVVPFPHQEPRRPSPESII